MLLLYHRLYFLKPHNRLRTLFVSSTWKPFPLFEKLIEILWLISVYLGSDTVPLRGQHLHHNNKNYSYLNTAASTMYSRSFCNLTRFLHTEFHIKLQIWPRRVNCFFNPPFSTMQYALVYGRSLFQRVSWLEKRKTKQLPMLISLISSIKVLI